MFSQGSVPLARIETSASSVASADTGDGGVKGRILILVENLPVPFDRRIWQEAKSLHRAGYIVSIICPKGKGQNAAEEELDGIHIYRHSLPFEAEGALGYLFEYGIALFHQARLAIRIRRRHGFDVIQAANPPDLMFLTVLPWKIFFGTRFVFDHHDLCPELFEVKFARRGFLWSVMGWLERRTFALADASIATNETFRDIAISRGGMAPGNVRIVRSYPEHSRFQRRDPDPAAKAVGTFLVGYVGIIGTQDGVDLFVQAMAEIVHTHGRDEIHAMIVGDGPALSECQRLADALGVADHIRFTGYLSGAVLLEHLSAFDIAVIPDPSNAFNDKLSMNKVFEYMALGLPIVMFPLVQAAAEAGAAAHVVPDSTPDALASGIVALVDDPERRQDMAVFGSSYAQKTFTWESQEPALLETYADVLSR